MGLLTRVRPNRADRGTDTSPDDDFGGFLDDDDNSTDDSTAHAGEGTNVVEDENDPYGDDKPTTSDGGGAGGWLTRFSNTKAGMAALSAVVAGVLTGVMLWTGYALRPSLTAGAVIFVIVLVVTILSRRRAATKETAVEVGAPHWGKQPGRFRVLVPVAALLALGVVGSFAYLVHQNQTLAARTLSQADVIDSLRAQSPPGGFAEQCLALWLSAGGTTDAAAGFIDACNPGVSADQLVGQTQGVMQAAWTTAYGAPLTTADPSAPNYFSVLVAAGLREYTVDPTTAAGTWVDRGVGYFRVSVWMDPNGRPAMRGLPRSVASPTNTTLPNLALDLASANANDPRTGVLNTYVLRNFTAPPTDASAQGDIANLLWPGTPATTLHDPNIADAEITAVTYTDQPANPGAKTTQRATARVLVTYAGGAQVAELITFTISTPDGSQWLIQAIAPTQPWTSQG